MIFQINSNLKEKKIRNSFKINKKIIKKRTDKKLLKKLEFSYKNKNNNCLLKKK